MKIRNLQKDKRFVSLIILISLLTFSTISRGEGAIKVRYKLKDGEQIMTKIEGVCKELLEKTEFVTILTWDENGPHLVGNWGDYLRTLGIRDGNIILLPAGHYYRTEENLKKDKHIQLMVASKQVQGTHGPGQGCVIYGEGEVQTDGAYAQMANEKFPWARGVLVIRVKEVELHL